MPDRHQRPIDSTLVSGTLFRRRVTMAIWPCGFEEEGSMCSPGPSATRRSNRYLSVIDAPPPFPHCVPMESRIEGRAIDKLLVAVVDDDESVRESLPDLLRELGFSADPYSSAEEFLASDNKLPFASTNFWACVTSLPLVGLAWRVPVG